MHDLWGLGMRLVGLFWPWPGRDGVCACSGVWRAVGVCQYGARGRRASWL